MPSRFRKSLRLAPSYVGIDALTQAELLRVAALDFTATAVRTYLSGILPEPPARAGHGGLGPLTTADYVQRAEWTRDVFLALRLHEPSARRRPGAGLAARLSQAAPTEETA